MSAKSKKETFRKGDRVSARWSGSNLFYDAKVVDVTARTYKVQFDDGSIHSIKQAEVKKLEESPVKESPPPKTVAKPKSRSRSRSTGRGRSRSKSPARKEKQPRTKSTERKSSGKEKKSRTNNVSKDEPDTRLPRDRVSTPKADVSKSASSNSITKVITVTLDKNEGSSERFRSTRLAAQRTAEAARAKLAVENALQSKKAAKYSDGEEEEEEEESPRELSMGLKALYFLVTLLKMLLTPASLLFLVFSCTKRQCTVLEFPLFYSRWRDLGNSIKFPLAFIFAYHMVHVALALIPLGKRVNPFVNIGRGKKKEFQYRLNGWMILMLNLIVFSVCAYFGVYTNWGYEKFRGIAMSCAIYCVACAVALHIYALVQAEGLASSKVPLIGSFYSGAYINPLFFGRVDLKTSFLRAGLMGSVLLNASIVLKYFLMRGHLTIPMAMTASMQLFYVLDWFVREERMLSTATYTSDTTGYGLIVTSGFLLPIGMALQNIFLYNTEARMANYWAPPLTLALFFVGYYIYLSSSNLKHSFRQDPFSPSLAEVVSIPTAKKQRRLIASGWWGRLRHPNYLGLIIMAVAWTLPCGFTHFTPFGPLLLLVVGVVVRTLRIESECREKYGPAWKNYTEKVRSRIVPFIF